MASGSSTSSTQRGTTTGCTRAGGAGGGCSKGSTSPGACSPTPASGFAASSSVCSTYASMPGITAILFIGDVVGRAGRRVVRELVPALREELGADFVVVNGENAAGGLGITPKEADEMFGLGVDVITLGNHTYRQREVFAYLDEQRDILRPANFLPAQPGHGTTIVERGGVSLGVVSLSGNLHMQAGSPALGTVDGALREVGEADHVLVDMHAEATSEKIALGWYL